VPHTSSRWPPNDAERSHMATPPFVLRTPPFALATPNCLPLNSCSRGTETLISGEICMSILNLAVGRWRVHIPCEIHSSRKNTNTTSDFISLTITVSAGHGRTLLRARHALALMSATTPKSRRTSPHFRAPKERGRLPVQVSSSSTSLSKPARHTFTANADRIHPSQRSFA
jgi:hypothetical protein